MYSPYALVVTGIILPLLGVIAVCFRFYARISLKHPIGVDDWLILAACILVCGMGVMQIVGMNCDSAGVRADKIHADMIPLDSY